MTAPYRLYGAELSPYSLKVRSYLRYKGLAHEWIARSQARADEFQRYAKLPLIPVLVGADESVLQDSTPMIERLEQLHPDPTITPEEPALAFVSALIEDYADEWLNKPMFHLRWSNEADAAAAAARIVDDMLAGMDADEAPDRESIETQVRERMTSRLGFVGSTPETGPLIEASFRRALALLNAHLAQRSFLFGGRPSLADFAIGGQLQTMLTDPTAGAIIRDAGPHVAAYAARMASPEAGGPFEALEALRPTLAPLLEEEVAGRYLPWAEANAQALRDPTEGGLTVEIMGAPFRQTPQRYAAKAFLELRRKRASSSGDAALAALMEATGCDVHLAPPTSPTASSGDLDEGGEDEDAPASAHGDRGDDPASGEGAPPPSVLDETPPLAGT